MQLITRELKKKQKKNIILLLHLNNGPCGSGNDEHLLS